MSAKKKVSNEKINEQLMQQSVAVKVQAEWKAINDEVMTLGSEFLFENIGACLAMKCAYDHIQELLEEEDLTKSERVNLTEIDKHEKPIQKIVEWLNDYGDIDDVLFTTMSEIESIIYLLATETEDDKNG